jgi:ABC-type phosphate transport system permease subunit
MPSIIGLFVLVLDVIALVSLLGGRGSGQHKVLWTLVILLLPVVGMVLYFAIGRIPADRRIGG